MQKLLLFLVIFTLIGICFANYTGHSLVKFEPKTKVQIDKLMQLQKKFKLDIWNENIHPGLPILVRVPPESVNPVISRTTAFGLNSEIVIQDLEKAIFEEKQANSVRWSRSSSVRSFDFGQYHRLSDIYDFLKELSSQNNDVKLYNIGQSVMGYDIKAVSVTTGDLGTKPVIFLECGIHAREWVAPASCLWMLNELANDNSGLKQEYEWVIVPVANPEGYSYTWTNERLWRKNLSGKPGSWCKGVDVNRNFDSNFGGPGGENDPCSDLYFGEYAFSEKESQAIRDLTLALGNRIKAYFAVHAYSQLWMTPYGYTKELSEHHDELMRVGQIGANALGRRYGTKFNVGPISQIIYVSSGSVADWVHDHLGVKYAYAFELRDKGRYGFMLPKEQIIPTAEETFDGIKAAIEAME